MREYLKVVHRVIDEGTDRAPRGLATIEVLGATVINTQPYDLLPPPWRKPNLAILAAEALQLIGGVSHPLLLKRIAAPFGNFMDGGVFHGAYGPRLRTQLRHVVKRLRLDPASRQAVLTIWDPLHDLITYDDVPRDVPCTLTLQYFLTREGLEAHTSMRSNDCFLGLAYDVGQFTLLADVVAKELGTVVSRYVHHAASLHVYERDLPLLRRMQPDPGYEPMTVRAPGFSLESSVRSARLLLEDGLTQFTSSEQWFKDTLDPYL